MARNDSPDFITPSPCHVSDPLYTAVVALLEYLEVSNQQAAAREHQEAEAHAQRRPAPRLLVGHGGQLGLGAQHELALSGEPSNLPHYMILCGLIFGLPLCTPLGDSGGVQGRRDADDNVSGEQLGAKVCLDADAVLDLGLANLVDDGVDLEWQVDVLGGAVAHELELAIGRDEGDDAIGIELAQLDALVELAIFEGDTTSRCLGSLGAHPVAAREAQQSVVVEKEPVIEAELALGGAGQVGAHDDLACDVGSQDGAGGGHEQVDVLDHIDKGLVLAVLDVGLPPGQGASGLHCDLCRVLKLVLGLDTLGGDIHLEGVSLGVLGVAEVDDLVEQLVDQDEVVLYGLFIELAEVAAAELDQAVEELEDEGGIRVALGDGDQVYVLVLDMAEGGAAQGQDGRAHLGIADDLDAKDIGEPGATVVAKGTEYEVLALLVEYQDAGEHCEGRTVLAGAEAEPARNIG